MTQLTSSVGRGGQKNHGDIAVVQMLLHVVKNPDTKKPFYNFPASGRLEHDHQLIEAILAFQRTFALIPAAKTSLQPALVGATAGAQAGLFGDPTHLPARPANGRPPRTIVYDKAGLIEPNSATFLKLVEEAVKVSSEYNRVRALPKTKYLYLEMTDVQFQAALKAVGDSQLENDFKETVLDYIKAVYREHRIVLQGWDARTSYRRTFQEQHAALISHKSQAHPGEGLHNYGLAIDVGYTGLTMVLEDGDTWEITDEDDFQDLAKHYHDFVRQNALFKVRNDIWEAPAKADRPKEFKQFGGSGSLFRILLNGGDNDPNHFQAYNQFKDIYPDDRVDMQRSLAAHLSNVSSTNDTTMQWENVGHNHHYACDLGLGIKPIDVGTADQIWSGHPHLPKTQYVHALKQKNPKLKDTEVADKDYEAVLKSLTAAFHQAEHRWKEWEPLRSDGTSLS